MDFTVRIMLVLPSCHGKSFEEIFAAKEVRLACFWSRHSEQEGKSMSQIWQHFWDRQVDPQWSRRFLFFPIGSSVDEAQLWDPFG